MVREARLCNITSDISIKAAKQEELRIRILSKTSIRLRKFSKMTGHEANSFKKKFILTLLENE